MVPFLLPFRGYINPFPDFRGPHLKRYARYPCRWRLADCHWRQLLGRAAWRRPGLAPRRRRRCLRSRGSGGTCNCQQLLPGTKVNTIRDVVRGIGVNLCGCESANSCLTRSVCFMIKTDSRWTFRKIQTMKKHWVPSTYVWSHIKKNLHKNCSFLSKTFFLIMGVKKKHKFKTVIL